MSEQERDSAEDWSVPERSRPPLLGELVERIDEALATARASEAAVMTVGAAALDAAEQARRAAELAERASVAMNAGSLAVTSFTGRSPNRTRMTSEEPGMDSFTARADRVAERLRRLQRLPLSV